MPRIFDNIDEKLLDNLKYTAQNAFKADFCVGYFNLRGWRLIADEIDKFSGEDEETCRVLIGMQKLPSTQLYEELKIALSTPNRIDSQATIKLKKIMAQDFREQLMVGVPTSQDEKGLQKLRQQLLTKKVIIKLHCRYNLHAKLYLLYQDDRNLPIIGYLGSSNLTFSGLKNQGELNIDVLDHDATNKLKDWFNDRWNDNFCVDISQELAEIINESWASEKLIPPYHIYLKMAYHLSQEARDGLSQYSVPSGFDLFPFQEAAVRIAAHHVNRRGGVIIGDVVGLGKTLVGSAIARIIEEDFGISTLIICPANLVTMWSDYRDKYGLRAKVLSMGKVVKELPDIPARFRLVLIDESHNLRNRDGKRYAAIKDYIEQSGSRCILLTATPYNKSYLDLSSQLRLFIKENQDLGIKPEALIRNINFTLKHPNISPRTLPAFEKSEYSEDWQQLMSRYMVRRTRSFIRDNYTKFDPPAYSTPLSNGGRGNRKYLEFSDGKRSYFPDRIPKTATFTLGTEETDPYAKLYSDKIVDIISQLTLPRYALGTYELKKHQQKPTDNEQKILEGLSRAGKNLIGFCRTNLFKRLESSGDAFIQSIQRHILRNYIYLYAIESGLDIPIGTQNSEFFYTVFNDQDTDSLSSDLTYMETEDNDNEDLESFSYKAFPPSPPTPLPMGEGLGVRYQEKAREVYQLYQGQYKTRFKWLKSSFFNKQLTKNLREDAHSLMQILQESPIQWHIDNDQKLGRLYQLLTEEYPEEKVLIFSQFADTVNYLDSQLKKQGLTKFAIATGKSENPTVLAQRFSPKSNGKTITPEQELRILIATDVLSEGQNLQDCRIIVNYDLPWAIIRLIQRAGRVDRIGQEAEEILCYSFLPAEGVERLINLRGRLQTRLDQNAEVVGTDEVFFEEMTVDNNLTLDLYHEKAGILDDIEDLEVDLTSEALSIWETAEKLYPELTEKIKNLPNVIYSTRQLDPPLPPLLRVENEAEVPLTKGDLGGSENPEGVLMYLRTEDGVDALAYVNKEGNSVTQSQSRILRLARCELETKAIARHPQHYDLVAQGAKIIAQQQRNINGAGNLGSPSGAKAKTYKRLEHYMNKIKEMPLLAQGAEWESLNKAIQDIFKYPLRESAIVKLNRQLRSGITDEQLAKIVISLMADDALCIKHESEKVRDNQIICSLGLF